MKLCYGDLFVFRMDKYHCESNKSNKDEPCSGDDKTKLLGSNKKLTTMWRYIVGDQGYGSTKTGNSKTNKNTAESVIGIPALINIYFGYSFVSTDMILGLTENIEAQKS